MGIRVVDAYPNRGGFGRFMRAVVALVGALLLFVGLVATGVAVAFGVAMVITVIDGKPEEAASGVSGLAILVAVGIVGSWLGLRLIRGRRRLGLFLRRFGYLDATRTMSAAVAGQSGSRWRMVTLDDASVAPLGTARRHRRVARWLAVLAFALVAWVVAAALTSEPATYESTGDFAGDIMGAIIAVIVQVLFLIVLFAFAIVIAVLGAAAMAGSRAARAATERASVVIERADQVRGTAARIRRNNRRVFGSRLVVARVATPLWQDVVHQLAGVCDAVVIDVSHASDNVLWEVESLRTPGRQLVLVCHRDRIAHLLHAAAAPAGGPGSATSADVRLARALDGHEVLAYGSGETEQRRFARSLRNRLATT